MPAMTVAEIVERADELAECFESDGYDAELVTPEEYRRCRGN